MKKIMVAMMLMPLIALANFEKIGDVIWAFDLADGNAIVLKINPATGPIVIPETKSSPVSGPIVIPDRLCGHSVTGIGRQAFYGCSGLTSVTIPKGVTCIGELAFCCCRDLASVVIPQTVTNIDWGAFKNCSGLMSVTIPQSVTNIEDDMFCGCSGLTSVTIPSSVTSIEAHAFDGCGGLTSVTIPESVTNIGDSAFKGCTGLTSVMIPKSVRKIGEGAFSGCTRLTSITLPFVGARRYNREPNRFSWLGEPHMSLGYIFGALARPDTVRTVQRPSIGAEVYYIPMSLKTVVITDETEFGPGAFENCSGLSSVTIPERVTSIGSGAFKGCSGLTSVTIPGGVTNIGNSVFEGCTGLMSVMIPKGVREIGDCAFHGCTGLTSVMIPKDIEIGKWAFMDTPWELRKRTINVIVGFSAFILVLALMALLMWRLNRHFVKQKTEEKRGEK